MNHAQGGPAVLLGLHNHPNADEVVDRVELVASDHHLLVDAPEVLWSTGDFCVDVYCFKLGTKG